MDAFSTRNNTPLCNILWKVYQENNNNNNKNTLSKTAHIFWERGFWEELQLLWDLENEYDRNQAKESSYLIILFKEVSPLDGKSDK